MKIVEVDSDSDETDSSDDDVVVINKAGASPSGGDAGADEGEIIEDEETVTASAPASAAPASNRVKVQIVENDSEEEEEEEEEEELIIEGPFVASDKFRGSRSRPPPFRAPPPLRGSRSGPPPPSSLHPRPIIFPICILECMHRFLALTRDMFTGTGQDTSSRWGIPAWGITLISSQRLVSLPPPSRLQLLQPLLRQQATGTPLPPPLLSHSSCFGALFFYVCIDLWCPRGELHLCLHRFVVHTRRAPFMCARVDSLHLCVLASIFTPFMCARGDIHSSYVCSRRYSLC